MSSGSQPKQSHEAVNRCRAILKQLDLLDLEDRYEEVYSVRWDICMADAIDAKGMNETAMTRLVVARFLKLSR